MLNKIRGDCLGYLEKSKNGIAEFYEVEKKKMSITTPPKGSLKACAPHDDVHVKYTTRLLQCC
jgi:hypothetical protein